jgi:tetratricopeptide (TPR) repeat protein
MKNRVLIFLLALYGVLFVFSGCGTDGRALEYYEKGKALYTNQRIEEALHYFEKAVSADSNFKQAYVMCAKCYFYLNREKSAIDTLAEVLKKYPLYVDANFWAGKINFFLNDHTKAEEYLLAVIDEDSNHVDSRYLLGDIYLKRGDLERALLNYSAVEMNLNIIALSKIRKGEIFVSAGQNKKAADELFFIDRNKQALDLEVLNEAYNLISKINYTEKTIE